MRSRHASRRADAADRRIRFHAIAFAHVHRRQMRKHGKDAQTVIDHDGVAGEIEIARDDDASGVRGVDRRAGGAREIGAAVRAARPAIEDASRAELAVGRLRHWTYERRGPQALWRGPEPPRPEERGLPRGAVRLRPRRGSGTLL